MMRQYVELKSVKRYFGNAASASDAGKRSTPPDCFSFTMFKHYVQVNMDDFSPPPLRAPTACVACNKKKVREWNFAPDFADLGRSDVSSTKLLMYV
jgi:hypothetical protein